MDWIRISFFIFVIILAPFLIYIGNKRRKELMKLYERQAVKRNGTVQKATFSEPPRLNLTDEGKTVSIHMIGGGKNNPVFTVMRRELESAGNMSIFIGREGTFVRIGKSFGLRDIQVGDPIFDDLFLIRGSNEFAVQSILSPEVRDHILRMKERSLRIRIEKNVFDFSVEGSLKNDEEYDWFIETGLAILGKAKSLYRAGETDYPAGSDVTQGEAIQAMPGMYGESVKTRSKGRTAIVVGLVLIALFIAGYYALAGLNKGDRKGPGETIRYGMSYLLSNNNERLILATKSGDISTMRDLLKKGVNPNTTDNYSGWSVLMWSSWKGRADIVKLLLDNGAEVNAKKTTNLLTALWVASGAGHTEVVKLLLDRGADVDAKKRIDGATALMAASRYDYAEVVSLLLDNGADVNVKATSDGSTALIIASWYGRTGVVRLLLDNGADVDSKAKFNNAEWTALKSAKKNGHADIVQLLEKAGAKE